MPMWVKRLLRPLIPDRVMARYRLRQHSRQVRTNVDVLVADRRAQRRWLVTTPDTYRVGAPPGGGVVATAGDDVVMVGAAEHADAARHALADTGADAAVVGHTTPPRLIGRRRTEPAVSPLTLVVRRGLLDEVSGVPDGDLVGLHQRLRDAGARFALVPMGHTAEPARRMDPLQGPVVVMLAAVPMHDVGGGSRTTQLALELLRRGVAVVYVSVFGSDEGADLGIRYLHPRLEQVRLDEFDPATVADRADEPGWVLAELPATALVDPVSMLRDRGWRLCYDLIDRWADRALGGEWYRADTERWFLTEADAVVASAPDLVGIAAVAGVDATLIPNAVNEAVFASSPDAVPDDLPDGDGPIFGYHGSLYGDWIDWPAIASLAEAHPQARVVLIGDASKGHPPMPSNVHFLGLKPQADLPAYVRRFDVGLVPFTVTETTHAVSPLKVYEYLACAVPVAAPPLRALDGLDGVTVAGDLVTAVAGALAGPVPTAGAHSPHIRGRSASRCCWIASASWPRVMLESRSCRSGR
jgi:glycosyltransferase involved in cell wall biosynthesis